MNTTTDTIASRLADALTATDTADARRWTWQPLLHLLARGEPVTADDLAAATGRPVDQVRAVPPALPSIERDHQGRVVGSGITLRPTPHQFEVDDRHLYTWCALDTLIFPAILGRTARVVSPCHTTGTPIRLTVEPTRLAAVDPPTTVVSIVTPNDMSDVRAAFCNEVHFFRSPQAAQPWLANHPEATVVPVGEAFDLGRRLTPAILAADGDACC
jgi:alkylmercury lyase